MDPDTQAGTGTADTTPSGEQGEGQGQGTGNIEGLYQEFLAPYPEELHPRLQEDLKKLDGNFTRRFQDAAEFRKQWEPLAGVEGLSEMPAETVQGLVQWSNMLDGVQRAVDALDEGGQVSPEDEQAFDHFAEWWEQVGQTLGLMDGDGDPDGGEPESDDLVAELRERIDQLENGWKQREAQSEQEQRVQKFHQDFQARLSELAEQHQLLNGDETQDKETLEAIARFARDYVESDDDPIARGVDDFLKLTGRAKSELVSDRLGQPAGSIAGGAPDTTAGAPKTFREAKAAAQQRMGAGVT